MILPTISIILIGAIIFALLFSVQFGILLSIAAKPIIDTSWFFVFSGINPPRVIAGLFPLLVLLHARGKGRRITEMPLSRLWLVNVIYLLVFSTTAFFTSGPQAYFDQVLRALNGFVGFYMLQAYFSDMASFRRLVKYFLIAGIFPLSVAMYQAVTGAVFTERIATGFIRNVGFYHDSIALRQFSFQTIMAVILYWGYFVDNRTGFLKRLFLIGLLGASLIAVFNLYTKAGYMIIALWTIIWTLSRRQFVAMAAIIFLVIVVNIIFYERIWSTAEQVYWKELSAIKGGEQYEMDSDERVMKRSFSGRWYKWEQVVEEYLEAPVFQQLFGLGHGVGAHNDYLNRLASAGMIGLIIYVTLLITIGSRVFKNYLRSKEPINVVALMLFTMWMVDTIGLVPSAYTGYQWYTWGIIALSLKGLTRSEDVRTAASGTGRKTTLMRH